MTKSNNSSKPAVIAVLGDSWSTSQFGYLSPRHMIEGYPPLLSVSNRLRTQGHVAYELAVGGDSIDKALSRLDYIIERFPGDMSYFTHIVLGWTEWCRNLNLPANRPGTPIIQEGSYLELLEQTRAATLARLQYYTDLYPHIKWLHWGGLSRVWSDLPKRNHKILYDEYPPARIPGCPSRGCDLFTFAPRSTSAKEITRYILVTFPGTDFKLAGILANNLLNYYRWTWDNPQYLADGAHLNFEYYDLLADTIHKEITGTR